MRKFNVTVNGTVYEVEVEEVGAAAPSPVKVAPVVTQAPVAQAPAPAPQAPKAEAPKPAAKPQVTAGGQSVKCPMPGTILDLRVKPGDVVKKGAILMILEAMKMENEILSPADGTVAQVLISKGASVNSGEVLVVIS